MASKYIKGFDGLRAISIAFVLFGHLGYWKHLDNDSFFRGNPNLHDGVLIFFAISGFLITSLLLSEKEANGKINFKYFFIRRFLRLLPPLLILLLIISALMFLHFLPINYPAVLISFFYLYNFAPFNLITAELGHTWSLGVEEQFYLFWPFVVNRITKIKQGYVISVVIVFICLLWNLIYPLPIVFNNKPHYLTNYFYVGRWFIPACLPIMIGSLTSMVLFNNRTYLQRSVSKNYLLPAIALLLYTAQLYIPGLSSQFISVLQPSGVSILLLWIYFNQESAFVKFLEFKPISFLGKISYGVYIYQGLFLRNSPGGKLLIQQFPLNICLTLLTAAASYYLVEKKIMKYKDRFRPKETASTPSYNIA